MLEVRKIKKIELYRFFNGNCNFVLPGAADIILDHVLYRVYLNVFCYFDFLQVPDIINVIVGMYFRHFSGQAFTVPADNDEIAVAVRRRIISELN